MGMMMMKKESVVAVVMVVLVVAAQVQAQYGPPPPAESGNRPPHKRHCASKCALKCSVRLRLKPVPYMRCFNLCMLKCKVIMPFDSVFNCTSSCAHSKTHNLANTGTEAQKVEGYVESCYDSCSQKH